MTCIQDLSAKPRDQQQQAQMKQSYYISLLVG